MKIQTQYEIKDKVLFLTSLIQQKNVCKNFFHCDFVKYHCCSPLLKCCLQNWWCWIVIVPLFVLLKAPITFIWLIHFCFSERFRVLVVMAFWHCQSWWKQWFDILWLPFKRLKLHSLPCNLLGCWRFFFWFHGFIIGHAQSTQAWTCCSIMET